MDKQIDKAKKNKENHQYENWSVAEAW